MGEAMALLWLDMARSSELCGGSSCSECCCGTGPSSSQALLLSVTISGAGVVLGLPVFHEGVVGF